MLSPSACVTQVQRHCSSCFRTVTNREKRSLSKCFRMLHVAQDRGFTPPAAKALPTSWRNLWANAFAFCVLLKFKALLILLPNSHQSRKELFEQILSHAARCSTSRHCSSSCRNPTKREKKLVYLISASAAIHTRCTRDMINVAKLLKTGVAQVKLKSHTRLN